MPAKKPPTGTDRDLNLVTLSPLFVDEEKARDWLESKRWPDGIPFCPHCGEEGYALYGPRQQQKPRSTWLEEMPGLQEGVTVRVGTIFEESKLPISKWLMAIHLMTSSKKGISSHQMARELGCTQKTAWFLCHRIRECMKSDNPGQLMGVVEADESWVGGKPRHKNNNEMYPKPLKKGPGGSKETPVMVLVERGGNSIAFPIPDATAPTLKGAVRKLVDPNATLRTDDNVCYHGLGAEFAGGHETVAHSRREYVRYDNCGAVYASNNTAESWFALLKRSHYGIHHSFSETHLPRYCNERQFMWNNRKVSDGERMIAAINGAEGRRLMYR